MIVAFLLLAEACDASEDLFDKQGGLVSSAVVSVHTIGLVTVPCVASHASFHYCFFGGLQFSGSNWHIYCECPSFVQRAESECPSALSKGLGGGVPLA